VSPRQARVVSQPETRAGRRPRRPPEPEFLYLTTTGRRTGLPREIEIWFTRRDARYYLVAETGERAHWVRNLRANPRVQWRVGRRTYSGTARAVDPARAAALAATVRARSTAKYGWGDGVIVELRSARTRRLRG
jgi:deazaflavin-dependent oxidoreductase (nitroreductase family)